ncbi:unnamed protein product [Arabis nemorensis]|uniref:RNase H type-1 domain-containing protein n=1 Tax=Arabis nemorensis TaxID=586526 RepID=A0A565B429_9BRAS|nr:unnamed protein product [Arabis nemorensis]
MNIPSAGYRGFDHSGGVPVPVTGYKGGSYKGKPGAGGDIIVIPKKPSATLALPGVCRPTVVPCINAHIYGYSGPPKHNDYCYAAWREDLQLADLGWTFTHQHSKVLCSFSNGSNHVNSPLVAEGLAIRAVLLQATEEEIRTISVESDFLQLVRAINAGSCVSKLHGILSYIATLSKRFDSISFKFIPRTANFVGDSLAKDALYALAAMTV